MNRFECLSCGKTAVPKACCFLCPDCGEPLLAAFEPGPGRRAIRMDKSYSLERYADFLPLAGADPRLSLGEGQTPLIPLSRLSAGLERPVLFAKNEAQNPTGSFKDRGTAVAVQRAVASGFRRIGTVSTGNMAASTAAYGARAGLRTFVLLKEGTPVTSVRAAAIYGPVMATVEGDYGRLYYESLRLGSELGICFLNSLDPFRVEGYKITGYEIYLQLGRKVPSFLFVPLSSGGHLIGLMRAFADLEEEGFADAYPTFVGVQAEGCAPLVRAFESGKIKFERLEKARTVAHAISNPAPPGGNAVLKMIRERRGILISVSDDEMLDAQRRLASTEGLFCQPESAAALAGWIKLGDRGGLSGDGAAVVVLTGSGLKTLQALEALPLPVHALRLEDLGRGLKALARTA
jgi:threonine synthase